MAIEIDEYSLAAKPLEMRFGPTPISNGTGFIWRKGEKAYLITNWHNVTGVNPRTGKHISSTASEPTHIRAQFDLEGMIGFRGAVDLPVRDATGDPLWFEHPHWLRRVDVVALPLPCGPAGALYPINDLTNVRMKIAIGADAFVIGYPFGISVSAHPIWKRASIASEPQSPVDGLPCFFVDTASREGMSGSPVILRTTGLYLDEDGQQYGGDPPYTRFIGVYSGRIGAEDELKAQLGIVWRAEVVDQIIEGTRRGVVP